MVIMQRERYLTIVHDLAFRNNKMAFITGPRQVGKTTLALQIRETFKNGVYYNGDDIELKRKWIKQPSLLVPQSIGEDNLVVFDELHKLPKWKNILKSLYDAKKEMARFLVTGSARLDVYRRGGDSMLGRYFLFRLHPFSVGELGWGPPVSPDGVIKGLLSRKLPASSSYDPLFSLGGFPDPFLKGDPKYHLVWRQGRFERLVRGDLVDLSRLREMALMRTLMALLPERVGSPLSVQSLAEDLDSNHPTVRRWLGWLEQIYYAYLVSPYSRNIAQSLKKQPKLYLWDWSEIEDEAARFENLVAGHLLKAVHFWNDTGEGVFALFYLRNRQKEEVDFLVTRNKKPWLAVECKMNDDLPSSSLIRFTASLKPALALQVLHVKGAHQRFETHTSTPGIMVSADQFLGLLP